MAPHLHTKSGRTGRGRRLPRVGAGLVALVAAAAGLGACRVPPDSLTVTPLVTGLNRPWDLAFTPTGDLLFTERAGRIDLRLGATGEVRVLAAPTDVRQGSEGGMLGIAVDPDFAVNRRIYTCFTSNLGGTPDVRVVRWVVNAASTGLTGRTDIITGLPYSTGRHSGCRPRFGPDGNLWVGTGDSASPTVPQNPASLGGKVLRVDTDGAGVAGNAPAPFDPRIYTYGHRNVQGLAFGPDGQAYSVEHGTDRDDELNRLVAGGNYGWDPRPLSGPSFYDESRPMTDTTRHPDARPAVWSSGYPTIAPSGATFLAGSQWAGWDGALAIAVLKGTQLKVIGLDPTGTTLSREWSDVADQGRLRSAVQGPDGALYLTQDANPGAILKVVATTAPPG